jgi:hypothetical protein
LQGDSRQIVRWWEGRRLHFNKVLAFAGTLTVILTTICAFVSDSIVGELIGISDGAILELFAIVLYATMANICYTSGWIVELFLAKRHPPEVIGFGVRAFRAGMKFSIALTLFPAIFCWTAFLLEVVSGNHPQGAVKP